MVNLRTGARILFRAVWNRLPGSLHGRLIYLGSPKVTMGACAVIADAQGRLLLVHHTHRHRGWDFPGGLIDRREQPATALAREVREELGVTVTVGPVLHVENTVERHHLTIFYRATIAGTPRHGVETDAHRYVTLSELADLKSEEDAAWVRQHLLPRMAKTIS